MIFSKKLALEINFQQIANVLNENSGVVIAFATIALVGITGYYAYQTRQTTLAIKKSSELSVMPHLKGSVSILGVGSVVLHISNVGGGPAINVKLKYWRDTTASSKSKWGRPILMSKEGDDIFIQDENGTTQVKMDFFKVNKYVIVIEGEYQDILGKKYEMEDSVDLTEYVNSISEVLYKEEPLNKIADHLRDIDSHLRRI